MPSAPTAAELKAFAYSKLINQTQPGPNGCKIWQGRINQNGYPVAEVRHTTLSIPRAVFEEKRGPIAKNWQVEPRCGQPKCINPKHLEQTRKSTSCKPLVGVPLPPGQSLKDAGYQLVHRPLGVSIWEPADIAHAVRCAMVGVDCQGCGVALPSTFKMHCSPACKKKIAAAKARAKRRAST